MANDLSISELKTYEALFKHQGARITFHCDQVTYEGIIGPILPDIRLVKLQHTKIVEGNHYLGNLRFKFRNISSFKIVESKESVNRFPKNEYLLKILRNNLPVPKDTIVKALYGDKLHDDSDDEDPEEEKEEEEFVLHLPEHLEHILPRHYTVIDTVSEDFDQAIYCMETEAAIGVSFHGSKISRFGKLTWVCISTEAHLFLFDIHQLGKEAFDKGLKQIFESLSVKKIIHDCSFPSDCLAHQYNTSLNNVFDTRVADFVVNIQRYNDKYEFRCFATLDCCLRSYLKVPQEFLFQRETLQCNSNQDRPITNDYLYDLLKSVVYLKLLQENLSKELLAPLHKTTGFYRSILSKSSQQLIDDLGSDLHRPDRIPQCLLMNGIQTVVVKKPPNPEIIPLKCIFINPQGSKVTGPYLGSTAAVRNTFNVKKRTLVMSDKGNLNQFHEASNQNIVPKPYLGSQEAIRNALNLRDIKGISAVSDKENVKEFQTVSTQDKISIFNNGVSKTVYAPSESFTGKIKSENSSSKPSFRHLDEVYHKLVQRMYPDQLGNIISVKPSPDYNLKISNGQAFSSCSDLNSSVNVPGKKTNEESNVPSKNSQQLNKNSECSDIWLKLRSEFLAEGGSADYKERKIRFVPG